MPIRGWLAILLALCVPAAGQAYDTGLLTSDEYDVAHEVVSIPVTNIAVTRSSTRLAATLYRPVARPDGPAVASDLPAILVATPYGRDGSFIPGGAGTSLGNFYASRGYLVLMTDTRGTGDSDGALEFTKIEIDDAVDTIQWLKDRPDVDPERIGMSGCSYLGAMQVLTAARKPGLRTIVPQAAWYDLQRAAQPGGTAKTVVDPLIIGIFSERAVQPRSDGTPHTLDPFEIPIPVETLLFLDPWVRPNAAEYRARSVYPNVAQIDIPVYMISSWKDDLIEVDHSLDLWRGISSSEKKLTIGTGGHCAWTAATQETQHAWFDHYLKDIPNGIDSDPPVDLAVQGTSPTALRTATDWPVPATSADTYYLRAGTEPNRGTLAQAPAGGDEAPALIANTYGAGFNDGVQAAAQDSVLPAAVPRNTPIETATWSLAVPAGLGEILGAPRVTLVVVPSSSEVQYSAKLYERRANGSRSIITRGVRTVSHYVGVADVVGIDLFSTDYRLSPGSTLELAVANSDALYVLPSAVPSLTRIGQGGSSRIDLPVIDIP